MFEKVFISDPNFKYTQYLTFDNFLLALCFVVTISAIFFIILDTLNNKNL